MPETHALPEKEFRSFAPGYWAGQNIPSQEWNSASWQLRHRITTLAQLEEHLTLSEEERAGVLLSGNKLAMAITPHYFNLIDANDPDCPIRRQVLDHGDGRIAFDRTDHAHRRDLRLPVQCLAHGRCLAGIGRRRLLPVAQRIFSSALDLCQLPSHEFALHDVGIERKQQRNDDDDHRRGAEARLELAEVVEVEDQVVALFENLKRTLAEAGLGFAHVARMTSYIKSYDPEFMATFRAVRLRYFNADCPPASVMVQAGLYDDRLLVESEVIAIAP